MEQKGKSSFTIKQVAEASGVSVRALRFYDEINLLKPAFYAENGYRHYEPKQLLLLQQILFYRELGFELSQIQKIIHDPQFDQKSALRSHREQLFKEHERTKILIQTIDQTLAHLEQETPMEEKDMYKGFDPIKQAEYESEIIQQFGEGAKAAVEESRRRTKNWKASDYQQVQKAYDEVHLALTEAIQKGLPPDSDEVQQWIQRHYEIVQKFWTPDRQSYSHLGKYYVEHADFRKLYDSFHPQLAEYLAKAIEIYANLKLT